MPLKSIIDDEQSIPEGLKEHYELRDGKYHLQVEGLKTESDVARVQAALAKERADHKSVKERFAVLGDRDPAEIIKALDRLPELELAAKGGNSEEKINSLVEARIKGRTAPLERERETLAGQIKTLSEQVAQYQEKDRLRSIHDSIRKAAIDAKVLPEATDDIIALAERQFDVDEDGKVTTKDGLDAKMWLKDMQASKPYYWPPSFGGGASGGSGSGVSQNPWSESGWNLTEQARIMASDMGKAEALAKRAGANLYGLTPPRK